MQKDGLRAIRLGFLGGTAFVLGMAITGLLASELVNGLWRFTSNDVLSASEINHNFDTLNTRIAEAVPVGTILAWHKSLTGTPGLPAGYVECNGQVLSDSSSPYNGQTLPNLNAPPNAWNAAGSFLRGGTTSGTFQMDTLQGHYHGLSKPSNMIEWFVTNPAGVNASGAGTIDTPVVGVTTSNYSVGAATTDGTNGAPRPGMETRPASMTVVWIMKIK